jgi:hypothetical protein
MRRHRRVIASQPIILILACAGHVLVRQLFPLSHNTPMAKDPAKPGALHLPFEVVLQQAPPGNLSHHDLCDSPFLN